MERRRFLESIAAAAGSVSSGTKRAEGLTDVAEAKKASIPGEEPLGRVSSYPRSFTGAHLSQIAFPLGGIGTGSISLGGRGQLRDWEIFNRPDKGLAPDYGFAAIWAKRGSAKPVAAVLESRVLPPFSSEAGLGPSGVPGLRRLSSATFSGEFPKARIEFQDEELPVQVSLEAFSPLIPLDAENSSFPACVLRYRVVNPHRESVAASIAFSLENPVGLSHLNPTARKEVETRTTEYRERNGLRGFFMTNPGLAANDPISGSFVLAVPADQEAQITYLRGWPSAKWWASPMLFWDDFSADGQLGPEAERRKPYASLCAKRELAPGASADFLFVLSWHFPNRTPAWCGWEAPKGHEHDLIGNYYCSRFPDAWDAAAALVGNLAKLEERTDSFLAVMRESTLPPAVQDAAMANLSTLVTQTCFQTSEGDFHGFEGCNDHKGCCFGNCTHVWNYESATQHLFPTLARSLRKSAFGFSEDDQGGMRHRQLLPDGIARYGYAAADGQMGQIIKVYLDYRMSGDLDWLRSYWSRVKLALSFPFVKGGWDPGHSGVLTGAQHNTYDVEFYGPNPLCGVYYLGALRAGEEIARILNHDAEAAAYRQLFERGRDWIDANLFNGEYYVQQIRPLAKDEIAPATVSDMGSETPEHPEFQVGNGCLADQLIGQYLADLAGLGPLLKPENLASALHAINRYNYRANLLEHDSVQRVYALNDEPAVLVCDYGRAQRPKIPFPYYGEAWTGMEYLVGSQMIFGGLYQEGVRVIDNVRRRYDGLRRNPWDEPECGHHYARAMSSWSGVIAVSGFSYHGGAKQVVVRPRDDRRDFKCFWSTGTGWGSFGYSERNKPHFSLSVREGSLPLHSLGLRPSGASKVQVELRSKFLPSEVSHTAAGLSLTLAEEVDLRPGEELLVHL